MAPAGGAGGGKRSGRGGIGSGCAFSSVSPPVFVVAAGAGVAALVWGGAVLDEEQAVTASDSATTAAAGRTRNGTCRPTGAFGEPLMRPTILMVTSALFPVTRKSVGTIALRSV
ncbi:hypothetical protein D2T81_30160 [Azospirillum brasilense]|nr:hypothetical protein D2T81_30160 [Azospirillum brasilense]